MRGGGTAFTTASDREPWVSITATGTALLAFRPWPPISSAVCQQRRPSQPLCRGATQCRTSARGCEERVVLVPTFRAKLYALVARSSVK
jgi:hypothetical protein